MPYFPHSFSSYGNVKLIEIGQDFTVIVKLECHRFLWATM